VTITGEIWALAASMSLAVGPLFAVAPARAFGIVAFSALRMLAGSVILLVIALVSVDTLGGNLFAWILIAGSSVVGIYISDILTFYAQRTIGARATSALYALQVPLTIFLAHAVLNETPTVTQAFGITLCFFGLCITILGRGSGVSWSTISVQPDLLRIGVLAGLAVSVCQAIAMVLIKSALQTGADPIAASAFRVTLAAVLVNPPAYGLGKAFTNLPHPFRPILFGTLASALAVNGGGMIFLMLAIAHSNLLASVSSLSSLAPVTTVPILWALTGHAPTRLAALGVIVAVAGIMLIVGS